ncbi:hypothetical protein FHS61_001965 [Altererythrobacter atlanticus]|uniref:Uncharacterized protein n=1 Tax=Croceibacterium atlanticum TaxID=1267766 RepID=A0A0F7KQN2_9SPHN|nr:hypothetical protein [Croceibacterium atlanticum]AKH41477.1 hypothetical protein WYH_00418 [Croceibacterium atlanticum]MBB5732939.1 hypothetical protein [Croceibacterium atlanticum]
MRRLAPAIFAGLIGIAMPNAVLAQNAPPPANADPAELAEARAIMEIMFPPAEREETFNTLIAQVASQFRQALPQDAIADPGLRAIVESYLDDIPDRLMPLVRKHLPNIIDGTAIAYTNEFSLEELRRIHEFAKTPAGEHYLVKSASLMGDPAVAAANTAYFADLQQAQRSLQQELSVKLGEYLKNNPEVAEQLNAN